MKTTIKLILCVMLQSSFYSSANETDNIKKTATPFVTHEYLEVFGLNPKKQNYLLTAADENELLKAESVFKEWIKNQQSEAYLKIFDERKFHFQHVAFEQFGEKKSGILVFIPEDKIGTEFHQTFGSGLDIPLERCLEAYADWYNNGEIFSAVINLETSSVENFKNWRVEKSENKDKAIDEYFATLDIDYALDISEINMEIHHYIDGTMHEVIPYENFNRVRLPKQRKSSLVFYVDGRVKGITCFDLEGIRYNCVMSYLTKIYLKDRLGYGKILYTALTCETRFDWQLMDAKEFENTTTLSLDELSKNSNLDMTVDGNNE